MLEESNFKQEQFAIAIIIIFVVAFGVYALSSKNLHQKKEDVTKNEQKSTNTNKNLESKPASTDAAPTSSVSTPSTTPSSAPTVTPQSAECYKVYTDSTCLSKIEYDAVIELNKVKPLPLQ